MKMKVYGKYGKMVLSAAKRGGANPDANTSLREVIDMAKRAGVPKDIVDRNLKRASDDDAADLEEHTIEVYGPGGSAFIMDCMTDNKTRATGFIWNAIRKSNGKMADAGSVLFNFQRRGEIVVQGVGEEEAFDAAVEAGAEDVEAHVDDDGIADGYKVVCSVESFGAVRDALRGMGMQVDESASRLSWKPHAEVEVDDEEKLQDNKSIFDKCLEIDDVDAIYTNCANVGV